MKKRYMAKEKICWKDFKKSIRKEIGLPFVDSVDNFVPDFQSSAILYWMSGIPSSWIGVILIIYFTYL
jgi:hypothetical protein